MSNSPPRRTTTDARSAYRDRWEAVETAKAQELSAMTDERARAIIASIGAAEPWKARPDWSGLVEQQAILSRSRQR